MRSNVSLPRAVVAGVLVMAVSGCGWFGGTDELYTEAPENRPLEVPPDLDLPRTGAAEAAPTGSVTASGTVAAAAGSAPTPAAGMEAPQVTGAAPAAGTPSGFNVAGSREEVFAQVDTALAAIEGVSVASRAELLGVFDVNYQQSNFLVRVSEVDGGAYVSAVDPRGMPATDAAAVQLIAQLQVALAAN
ncbi:hypothetical protein [Novilysobacter erysipheiresistens]|uniref:Beta-barrel assembly machine subunit BamC n=1 Tax=Novilysobacter erysipheiresistens TaxID=1749332 RepID=A0ABU7YV36_9GAMM